MLLGLNHLTLAVSEVERSFRFYVDVLGFTPKPAGIKVPILHWVNCGYACHWMMPEKMRC